MPTLPPPPPSSIDPLAWRDDPLRFQQAARATRERIAAVEPRWLDDPSLHRQPPQPCCPVTGPLALLAEAVLARTAEGRRAVPSAGGLHPVDLALCQDGRWKLPGVPVLPPDDALAELLGAPDGPEVALLAVPSRTLWKYGETAWMQVLWDAGVVREHLRLVSLECGLGLRWQPVEHREADGRWLLARARVHPRPAARECWRPVVARRRSADAFVPGSLPPGALAQLVEAAGEQLVGVVSHDEQTTGALASHVADRFATAAACIDQLVAGQAAVLLGLGSAPTAEPGEFVEAQLALGASAARVHLLATRLGLGSRILTCHPDEFAALLRDSPAHDPQLVVAVGPTTGVSSSSRTGRAAS